MKPTHNSDGGFTVKKGKTEVKFFGGTDRGISVLPVRIVYEGVTYPVRKYNLIKLYRAFEAAYSEEQVLEVIMDAIE